MMEVTLDQVRDWSLMAMMAATAAAPTTCEMNENGNRGEGEKVEEMRRERAADGEKSAAQHVASRQRHPLFLASPHRHE